MRRVPSFPASCTSAPLQGEGAASCQQLQSARAALPFRLHEGRASAPPRPRPNHGRLNMKAEVSARGPKGTRPCRCGCRCPNAAPAVMQHARSQTNHARKNGATERLPQPAHPSPPECMRACHCHRAPHSHAPAGQEARCAGLETSSQASRAARQPPTPAGREGNAGRERWQHLPSSLTPAGMPMPRMNPHGAQAAVPQGLVNLYATCRGCSQKSGINQAPLERRLAPPPPLAPAPHFPNCAANGMSSSLLSSPAANSCSLPASPPFPFPPLPPFAPPAAAPAALPLPLAGAAGFAGFFKALAALDLRCTRGTSSSESEASSSDSLLAPAGARLARLGGGAFFLAPPAAGVR